MSTLPFPFVTLQLRGMLQVLPPAAITHEEALILPVGVLFATGTTTLAVALCDPASRPAQVMVYVVVTVGVTRT